MTGPSSRAIRPPTRAPRLDQRPDAVPIGLLRRSSGLEDVAGLSDATDRALVAGGAASHPASAREPVRGAPA